MKKYIMDVHKFQEDNITVLMDDGKHVRPTRENMLAAYRKIVSESRNGDVVFCHYSGHGGKLRDTSGDEKDGYDEVSHRDDTVQFYRFLAMESQFVSVFPLDIGPCRLRDSWTN
jgi:hypothetical protein